MKPARILFITGTDTGVGKTVFAAVATLLLRRRGVRVAALKPICSGGREDARLLHAAAGRVLSLDEVNPWHFRAALAPTLAARRENRLVLLRPVVAHIRRAAKRFEVVIVEGAGGLLSPLGEKFDSRGDYVRRWLPELAKLPARAIHRPWQAAPDDLASAGVRLGATYPQPMVDHAQARARALAAVERLGSRPAAHR